MREAALVREARELATAKLAEAELPDVTRNRLVEQLSKNPAANKEGALDTAALESAIEEAIKAEMKYLAEATGSGRVKGMGGGDGPDEEEDPEVLEEADAELDKAFGALNLSEGVRKQAVAGRQ